MFLGMFLGFPSRVERDEIVAFVEATASKINAGIAIKEKQIVALKEYKTSLINAAVTGKVKVA
jgi:type I restriction enzyme S subunit